MFLEKREPGWIKLVDSFSQQTKLNGLIGTKLTTQQEFKLVQSKTWVNIILS